MADAQNEKVSVTPDGGWYVAYRRVSSTSQSTARQLVDVKAPDGNEIDFKRQFEDKCSGKNTKRPALQEYLRNFREGDWLYVHSIDRLARSLIDLQQIVKTLNDGGVTIVFVKEGLTFRAGTAVQPQDKLLLTFLAGIAEFERDLIKERQREGIEAAQANGRTRFGRPRRFTDAEQDDLLKQRENGVTMAHLARTHHTSTSLIRSQITQAKKRREAREAAQVAESPTTAPASA